MCQTSPSWLGEWDPALSCYSKIHYPCFTLSPSTYRQHSDWFPACPSGVYELGSRLLPQGALGMLPGSSMRTDWGPMTLRHPIQHLFTA